MRFIAADYGDDKDTVVYAYGEWLNGEITILGTWRGAAPQGFRPCIAEVSKTCDTPHKEEQK